MIHLEQAHIRLRRGHLYKYKSLRDGKFSHVAETVRDSMIFCPSPVQLNDPLECKPTLTIGDIADPAYRPKVDAWVRRCIAHRDPLPTEPEIQRELAGLTQARLTELVGQATKEYEYAVNKRYRVVSFADSRENDHVWREYADEYAGVCLEFFVDPILGAAYKVVYTEETPALDITNDEGFDALIQTVLIKRTQWQPEGEYRLVLGDPPIEDDPPLMQQRLQFPEPLLTGITFGAHTARDQRDALINLARFRSSQLTYCIATPSGRGGVKIGRLQI